MHEVQNSRNIFTVFWDGGIGKGTKEQCGLFKKLGH